MANGENSDDAKRDTQPNDEKVRPDADLVPIPITPHEGIREHFSRACIFLRLACRVQESELRYRLALASIYSCRAMVELMFEEADENTVQADRKQVTALISPMLPYFSLIERIRIHDFHRFGILPPKTGGTFLVGRGPFELRASKGGAALQFLPDGPKVNCTGNSTVKMKRPLMSGNGAFFDDDSGKYVQMDDIIREFLKGMPAAVEAYEKLRVAGQCKHPKFDLLERSRADQDPDDADDASDESKEEQKPDVPSGVDHLDMMHKCVAVTFRQSMAALTGPDAPTVALRLLGISMSVLYQAATCHRKCHGTGHVLEAMCGRMYNLGASSYFLITQGLYDEALNLTRSIGEIANLIALSVHDKSAIKEWIEADPKTRRRDFSPAAVRKRLKKCGHDELVLADDDWYATFCEKYTHPTPKTNPNAHNTDNLGHVGGMFQEDGISHAIGELAHLLTSVAFLICRYFDFDDLFAALKEEVKKAADDADGDVK